MGNGQILLGEWANLSGGGHVKRSAFDHSNLCQSKKHHSVNIKI